MNIIIDGVDFWDGFTAEKYWSPTKNQNLKEIVISSIPYPTSERNFILPENYIIYIQANMYL